MKQILLFCIVLFALPALAQGVAIGSDYLGGWMGDPGFYVIGNHIGEQRGLGAYKIVNERPAPANGEVIKDSLKLYIDLNECGDSVWFAYTYVEYRGGRKAINTKPVGYSDSDPCAGIAKLDTNGLFQAIANGVIEFDGKTRVGLLDYGRQQAKLAENFIFQPRALKSYTELNRALVAAGMPGLFKTMEKSYADSLLGSYILVRPGVNNANVTITKTAQGIVRVRLNAQTFFPVVVYGDQWIRLQNIAGDGQHVDLYQLQGEKGRLVSLLGNYQLVKSARQVVSRGIK